jgi:hypothetical protein
MINLKTVGAAALLALSPALMSHADAQQRTVQGRGFTPNAGVAAGGGAAFRGGGQAFQGGANMGASRTVIGNNNNFTPNGGWNRGGNYAQNGGNWNRGGWHGGYRRGWGGAGAGFAAGLATGAVLGAGSGYYGNGYYNNGYYGDGYYASNGYYGDDWNDSYAYDNGPTVVVGAQGGGDADSIAYCQQRFKSYDVRSGTYLGYDGERHSCP